MKLLGDCSSVYSTYCASILQEDGGAGACELSRGIARLTLGSSEQTDCVTLSYVAAPKRDISPRWHSPACSHPRGLGPGVEASPAPYNLLIEWVVAATTWALCPFTSGG